MNYFFINFMYKQSKLTFVHQQVTTSFSMLTLKKLVFVRHVHTYTLLDNPTGQSPGQLSLQIYNTLDISTTTLLNTCKE